MAGKLYLLVGKNISKIWENYGKSIKINEVLSIEWTVLIFDQLKFCDKQAEAKRLAASSNGACTVTTLNQSDPATKKLIPINSPCNWLSQQGTFCRQVPSRTTHPLQFVAISPVWNASQDSYINSSPGQISPKTSHGHLRFRTLWPLFFPPPVRGRRTSVPAKVHWSFDLRPSHRSLILKAVVPWNVFVELNYFLPPCRDTVVYCLSGQEVYGWNPSAHFRIVKILIFCARFNPGPHDLSSPLGLRRSHWAPQLSNPWANLSRSLRLKLEQNPTGNYPINWYLHVKYVSIHPCSVGFQHAHFLLIPSSTFFVVKLIRTAQPFPTSSPISICSTSNLSDSGCFSQLGVETVLGIYVCFVNHFLVTPKYRGSYKCSHRLMTNSMGDMKGESHQNERELSSSQVSLTMGCKDFVISFISSANPWF